MSETPNNDLEKQLRDYAQQRHDAAGTPELHPATRAMLQAEVKQHLGSTGATTASTRRVGWAALWPRLAFALGVIAILGVAAILLVPPGNKAKGNFTLARLDEAKSPRSESDKLETASPLTPATMPAPSGSAAPTARAVSAKYAEPVITAGRMNALEESTRRDTTPRKEAPRSFKSATGQDAPTGSPSRNVTAAAPPAEAMKPGDRAVFSDGSARPATLSRAAKGGVAADQAGGGSGVAAGSKTVAPAMITDTKPGSVMIAAKKAGTEAKDFNAVQTRIAGEGQNGLTQRYRNVVVAEQQKPSAQLPVLDEFTVAQNGEALTIVDRDGSVYNGYARLAPAERQAANYETSGAMQLVPNSNTGGRGAILNQSQSAANRSLDESRAQSQSQNLRLGQSAQTQSALAQNAIEPVNFYFRVEGTNRSLNQLVIVTGNLMQNGGVYNYASTVQNAGGAQVFQQQGSPASNVSFNNTFNAPWPNNFINGRVLLGNKPAGELNALSVDK